MESMTAYETDDQARIAAIKKEAEDSAREQAAQRRAEPPAPKVYQPAVLAPLFLPADEQRARAELERLGRPWALYVTRLAMTRDGEFILQLPVLAYGPDRWIIRDGARHTLTPAEWLSYAFTPATPFQAASQVTIWKPLEEAFALEAEMVAEIDRRRAILAREEEEQKARDRALNKQRKLDEARAQRQAKWDALSRDERINLSNATPAAIANETQREVARVIAKWAADSAKATHEDLHRAERDQDAHRIVQLHGELRALERFAALAKRLDVRTTPPEGWHAEVES